MDESRKNAFRVAFWLVQLVVPLVATPCVVRALGPQAVGQLGFSQSVAEGFVLLAMLGIPVASRKLMRRDAADKEAQSRRFWSAYLTQLLMAAISLAAYVGYLVLVPPESVEWAVAWGVWILAAAVDVSWLFMGLGDTRAIALAGAAWRVVFLVLVLALVRTPDDLLAYAVIFALTCLLSQLSYWLFLRRHVTLCRPDFGEFKASFKASWLSFVPIALIACYVLFDRIYLGVVNPPEELGYFCCSMVPIMLALVFVAALASMQLPRVFLRLEAEGTATYERKRDLSIWFAMAFAFCMMFGLQAVLPEFSKVYFTASFAPTLQITMALTPLIPAFCLVYFFGWRQLMDKGKPLRFAVALAVGAAVNIVLNVAWVPDHAAFGSAAATFFAGMILLIVLVRMVYEELPLSRYVRSFGPFCVIGLIMYCLVRLFALALYMSATPSVFSLVLELVLGFAFYCMALWFWSTKTNCPEFLEIFGRFGTLPQAFREASLTDALNASQPQKRFHIRKWLEESYCGPMHKPWLGALSESKRKMLAAGLTYSAYAVYLFFTILYSSCLARYIPIIELTLICLLVMMVADVIVVGRSLVNVLANLTVWAFAIFMLIMFMDSAAWGGIIVVCVFYARHYELDDFAQMSLVVTAMGLYFVVASAQADIIENHLDISSRTRHLLGFLGALYPSLYAYMVTLLTIYLSKRNLGFTKALALMVMSFFFFVYTGSRLSFYLSIVTIGVALVISGMDRAGRKLPLPTVLLSSIFVVCMVVSVAAVLSYTPTNPTWVTLNNLSGSRLQLARDGLMNHGITWFGQDVGASGNGLNAMGVCETTVYDYIDNAYIKLLVRWGIIWTVVYLAMGTVSMCYACWKKDPYLALCLTIIALHCLIDDLCLRLNGNPFFLVAGFALVALTAGVRGRWRQRRQKPAQVAAVDEGETAVVAEVAAAEAAAEEPPCEGA